MSSLFPIIHRGCTGRGQRQAQYKAIFQAWREVLTHPDGEGGTAPALPTQIYRTWQRRKDLKRCKPFDASGAIRTWKWIILFLRAGRQSKQFHAQSQRATTLGYLQQAERAAQAHNTKRLFGAVKRLIPWKPRPRIMLQHPDGAPMSLLQQHKALVTHCEQLFAPEAETPSHPGTTLCMPLTERVDGAAEMYRARQSSAWKVCSAVLAPALAVASEKLQAIDTALPAAWKDPQLCFLTGPIGLLRPDGKALAGHVKVSLLDQARPRLAHVPQYAYLPARDATDALAHVNACIQDIKDSIRAL